MIRHFLLIGFFTVFAHAAAVAQSGLPGSEDSRYQFNQVEDGYLRLDRKTGHVSLCSHRAVGWSCRAVADDRNAFDGEIARLQDENAALKKALLDRGAPSTGGAKSEPPVARKSEPDLKLPSDAEIERMVAVIEKVWRRLIEMIVNLQKDMLKKT